MKTLTQYCINSIDEYLSIKNIKDIKEINKFSNEYCIVQPKNNMFTVFNNKTYDYVENKINGIKLFILDKEEASKYANEEDVSFYKIPEKYENINELINDLRNTIDIYNLQFAKI